MFAIGAGGAGAAATQEENKWVSLP
jgi:hypothetical protein